jgi:ABC-type Na+ efflux pump permease subunit
VAPRRLGLLAVVLVLVATPALAGCGGEEESASEEWAGGVCSELSTWVTEVEEAVTSLTADALSLDQAAVQEATEDVRAATDELVAGLAGLEPPETEAGERARSELDELGTQLTEQLEEVEQAAESGSLELVAVTTALATAAAAVTSTFESLQSLDAGEELGDGFENASSCDSLRQQADTIGD